MSTRVLYHFPTSVFSKRTRLALAHKGLDVELRDGRADEKHWAEAKRLSPQGTMPVLVDDGRALGDSTAIAHYLDVAYPDRPALFPKTKEAAHRALQIAALVDTAMNTLVDTGTRFYALRNDPAWPEIVRSRMERAQGAIDAVAAFATEPTLAGDVWSAADIWALSATLWVKSFPARAASAPLVAQIITLGFRLPDALVTWAAQHEKRDDVRVIYT
jgi:glutathione S-transferase